jgi:hypothetical protein
MPSLLEALKKAELVDPKKAASVEEERTKKLQSIEKRTSADISKAYADEAAIKENEQRMARAAKEATKASSRVGTPQYLNRFK